MDALIQAFLAAALSEAGSRTGLLAAALTRRFPAPGAVLAGIALAAIVNMGVGAGFGAVAATAVPHRAIRLLTAVSLLLAGGSTLFPARAAPGVGGWRLGAVLSSAGAFLILALGDRGQFAVGAIAAATGAPILAAAGGAAGVVAASIVPVLLADRWPLPEAGAVRLAAAALLLLAGAAVMLGALDIV